jgi:holo-[acyl-carrier protein] synthase
MPTKFAHGIDIIEIDRIADVVRRHGDRFLNRIYTQDEITHCRGRIPKLAARFAAKEAVMKALGTGARSVAWRDIEVLPDRRGKPLVYLYGGARRRAEDIGLHAIDISLTHLAAFSMAVVVCAQERMEQDHEAARERLVGILQQRGLLGEDITNG